MNLRRACKKREWKESARARILFALLLLLALSFGLLSCKTSAPTNSGGNQSTSNATPATNATPTPNAQTQGVTFDGGRAYEHVRKQVDIGPRPAGSAELGRARDFIIS